MNKTTLILILIAVGVVLISGCATQDKEVECISNEECAENYCDEEKLVSHSCVEGVCESTSSECETGKVCTQEEDEEASCKAPYVAETTKPAMSCNTNSNTQRVTGTSLFDAAKFTCTSDCPKGFTCSAKCVCEEDKKKKAECSGVDFTLNIAFEQGYEKPYTDVLDFAAARNMVIENPLQIQTAMIEDQKLRVPAFRFIRDGNPNPTYLPFPSKQLTLTPPSPNHSPCANEYYFWVDALDSDGKQLGPVDRDCGYGAKTFDGVLTVCAKQLNTWVKAYETFS